MKSRSKKRAAPAPWEGWKWVIGTVDTNKDYIELRYGDVNKDEYYEDWIPVARIGPPHDRTFTVEFLIDPASSEYREVIKETKEELDFYLLEVGGPNPWAYAKYHCGTMANVYSRVHWSFFPLNDQLSLGMGSNPHLLDPEWG